MEFTSGDFIEGNLLFIEALAFKKDAVLDSELDRESIRAFK